MTGLLVSMPLGVYGRRVLALEIITFPPVSARAAGVGPRNEGNADRAVHFFFFLSC